MEYSYSIYPLILHSTMWTLANQIATHVAMDAYALGIWNFPKPMGRGRTPYVA